MNILLKQTLTASILSTMIASTAFAAPAEAPPAFVKKVADGLIARLKADSSKLQSNPALVKTIVRQNLDPYIDSQAFTRIVMGTYATNQYSSAAQRAQFEKNFRETLIDLQLELARATLELETEEIDNHSSGIFIDRLNKDTSDIAEIFNLFTNSITDVIVNIGIIGAVFVVNRVIFLYFFVGSALIILGVIGTNVYKDTSIFKRSVTLEKKMEDSK
mgnify:CR=1 FL=1